MDPVALVPLSWLLPLALLAVYVGSPRFLGIAARRHVGRVLRSGLDAQHYSVFEALTLPAGGGTFQPDVLVVSRHGVFVIATEERRGRISGTRVQALWAERRFGRTRRFDNPVHANALRIEKLQGLLSLPASRFHSLVAVVGQDRLDPGLPGELIAGSRLLGRIRAETRPLLSAEEADRAAANLRSIAIQPTWRERRAGWQWLRAALAVLAIGGACLAYRGEISGLASDLRTLAERQLSPERYDSEGRLRSAREQWEDALICSYSVDTGRCSCYEPDGERAEIESGRCRALAERGSVLQR